MACKGRVEKDIEELVPDICLPIALEWGCNFEPSNAVKFCHLSGFDISAEHHTVNDACKTCIVCLISPWSPFTHLDAVARVRRPIPQECLAWLKQANVNGAAEVNQLYASPCPSTFSGMIIRRFKGD